MAAAMSSCGAIIHWRALNKRPIQKGPVRDEHLSGVHYIKRIEGPFDFSHGVEPAAAYLQLDERRFGDPYAVFSGNGASQPKDYSEQFLDRFSSPLPLAFILSVEHDIGVDVAVSCVTKADYGQVVFFGEGTYGPDESPVFWCAGLQRPRLSCRA